MANYPKLVTASLDVPLASVQIAETESDQLELLPGLRKSSMHEDDILGDLRIPNGITLREFNADNDDYTMSNPPTPSVLMGYNPVEPLLLRYENQHSDSNDASLRRYVPMFGTRNGNRALSMGNEHVI